MANFYKCNICGNVVNLLTVGGGQLVCCGKPMDRLVPNKNDMTAEKHVPVVSNDENNDPIIKVGSLPHPMIKEHFIEWIYIECGQTNGDVYWLHPNDKPVIKPIFKCKKPVIYSYCNIHGLWSN